MSLRAIAAMNVQCCCNKDDGGERAKDEIPSDGIISWVSESTNKACLPDQTRQPEGVPVEGVRSRDEVRPLR